MKLLAFYHFKPLRLQALGGNGLRKKRYQGILDGQIDLPEIDVDEAVKHLKVCRRRRQEMRIHFAEQEVNPLLVFYEDLFLDVESSRCREKLNNIIRYVLCQDYEDSLAEKTAFETVQDRQQHTSDILPFFPNFNAAKSELERELAGR